MFTASNHSSHKSTYDLFLGGLPPTASQDDVYEALGSWWNLVDLVDLKLSQSGLNKGYAFLRISSEATHRMLRYQKVWVLGRCLTMDPVGEPSTGCKDSSGKRLFLKGIPYHITSKDLSEYFRSFGPVRNSYKIVDRYGGETDYGYVEFESKDSALAFSSMYKGFFIDEAYVSVKLHQNVSRGSFKKKEALNKPVLNTQIHDYPMTDVISNSIKNDKKSTKHTKPYQNIIKMAIGDQISNMLLESNHCEENIRINMAKTGARYL